jgi:hypothetical protein
MLRPAGKSATHFKAAKAEVGAVHMAAWNIATPHRFSASDVNPERVALIRELLMTFPLREGQHGHAERALPTASWSRSLRRRNT